MHILLHLSVSVDVGVGVAPGIRCNLQALCGYSSMWLCVVVWLFAALCGSGYVWLRLDVCGSVSFTDESCKWESLQPSKALGGRRHRCACVCCRRASVGGLRGGGACVMGGGDGVVCPLCGGLCVCPVLRAPAAGQGSSTPRPLVQSVGSCGFLWPTTESQSRAWGAAPPLQCSWGREVLGMPQDLPSTRMPPAGLALCAAPPVPLRQSTSTTNCTSSGAPW